ncbi:MAG: SGNH/GDSL hydrolase family protein [Ginsengibacter sp.]
MKRKLLLILVFAVILCAAGFSQLTTAYTWWDPAKDTTPAVEGQAWPKEVKYRYDRLPARAEKKVREPVWNLSHNSAGLSIRFRSSTTDIIVRYKVAGDAAIPIMPVTGTSGVDLYAVNSDGEWRWCGATCSFGDTIQYHFSGLDANDPYNNKGREYQLYLPLYNMVTWLEIGVPTNAPFAPLPARIDKPIVVYGTSIAQGGCASRPGMAWASILGRKSGRPVINLGFRANGKLEDEVINLLTEIDAKIYILDCLPNMDSPEETKQRVLASIAGLQQKRPGVPVLLVEHAGFSDGMINTAKRKEYIELNKTMEQTFKELTSKGVKNIFLLTKEEINLDIDCTVDGVHPSDLGMLRYADAYEKKIRLILNEPGGIFTTTQPCTQSRDANTYDWETRHNELINLNKSEPPRIVFLGNSITHYWGGRPVAKYSRGAESWNKIFEPIGVRNFGFGWDRIENVLWRVYHDELDGYSAEQIMIMIGTNNLEFNSNAEIVAGLKMLVTAVKRRQPKAGVLLIGLLPRHEQEKRIIGVNKELAKLSATLHIAYIDAGKFLLKRNGTINESLFSDGVHPNEAGYWKVAGLLKPLLKMPALDK